MKLLIVESPNKISKLKPILGAGWEVAATVGHFRDLPVRGWGLNEKTFRPEYEIQKHDVVKRLKQVAAKASEVYLATDPDREGEAIAWHVAQVCRFSVPVYRVTFNAITAEVVRKAIASPRQIDMALVNAQEARRVVDRLTGYRVSPALGTGATAGRVQSPALRLLVEREREIKSHATRHHFGVLARTSDFSATWYFRPLMPPDAEKPFLWMDEAVAKEAAKTSALVVRQYGTKEESRSPPPPFITSTLQQAASSGLGMSPDQCMKAAQALFEQGLITYHRTDEPNLSAEGLEQVRNYLQASGLPVSPAPRKFKSKPDSQAAHEAIRPSYISEETALGVDAPAVALYQLIRNRTLACQMADARVEMAKAILLSENVTLSGAPAVFVARGEKILFPGYKQLAASEFDDKDASESDEDEPTGALPVLKEGDRFECQCEVKAKKTRAPPRYTEAALIKKLEDLGIGRPSTYASIITGLVRRQHVRLASRKLVPQEIGFKIVDALIQYGFQFIEYRYTRNLEDQLDSIAASVSEMEARQGFDTCVQTVNEILTRDLMKVPSYEADTVEPLPEHGSTCPACNRGILKTYKVRKDSPNKGRRFLACSEQDSCKHMVLPPDEGWSRPLPDEGAPCPSCSKGSKRTFTVQKEGPNKGKRFQSCTEKACDWRWLPETEGWKPPPVIEPLPGHGDGCPTCQKGTRKTVMVSKEGPNKGKRLLVCTEKACDWMELPIAGGWQPRAEVEPLPNDGAPCPTCNKGTRKTIVSTKEGPNKGRRLQVCSERACKWMELPASEGWAQRAPVEPLPEEGLPCLQCGDGKQVTVQINKAGPNKGKRFLVCSKECGWREFPEADWPAKRA